MRRFRSLFFCAVALPSFLACAKDDPKDTRPTGPSLGQDIFGVLCDRVGAQALHEDLSGASYNDICHGDATTVDQSKIPAAPDANVRALAVAKIEALAKNKADLVAALDTVFPDDIVVGKNLDAADPAASCDPISSKTRREQLRGLLKRLLPTGDDDLVPESSRAAAKSIEPLTTEEGEAARVALTHFAARRGYMPSELSAGLLSSVLTAPRLRDLLGSTMHNIGPDADPYNHPGTKGKGYGAFKQLIGALQEDMREPIKQEKPLVVTSDAAGRPILSRPRTTLELGRDILLTEDPVFSNGDPLYVVKRDRRGMAVIKKDGKNLPSGFTDSDGDGLPDLDSYGRFAGGKTPDPFVNGEKDPTYEYIDARATAASALVRHLAPLADPDNGKESIMNAAEGAEPLLRGAGREAILDLVHAGAQVMADPGTDGALALFGQLFTENPDLMARVTGNLLDLKAIIDRHPEAKLPDGSTLIDDILDVVLKLTAEPGLFEDVLVATGDDRAQYITEALPAMMLNNDRLSYDPKAINANPLNLTTGGGPPSHPVDRTKPNTGFNRSIWQRFLALLGDTKGVTFCNHDNATLHATVILNGQPAKVHLPGFEPGPMDGQPPPGVTEVQSAPECAFLKIPDLSRFFLRSMIGKSALRFRPALMNPDPPLLTPDTLKISTGIDGFWDPSPDRDPKLVYPQPRFLNRQVFFKVDLSDPCSPDNAFTTNCVLKDLQGAHIPSSACKERSIPDPLAINDAAADGVFDLDYDGNLVKPVIGSMVTGLRTCEEGQYLDQRTPDTLFALEYNHAQEAFQPLIEIFVKHKKDDLLIELMLVLNKHWSVQGGVAVMEPAIAEILATDLIKSLGELGKVTQKMKVMKCVASGNDGCASQESVPAVNVLADGIRSLIDPARAKSAGVTDRNGGTKTKAGRDLTILGLARDALNAEDAVITKDKTLEHKWTTARSNIVDEFLTINGRGEGAKFNDPGIPRLAPVVISLLRAQRIAKCGNDPACPELRKQLALDVADTMNGKVFNAALDFLDAILADKDMRGEVGRMTSYMFRAPAKLGGDTGASASSTPFSGSKKGPGILDQSTAAIVDALGALGDLSDMRKMYPFLATSLDEIDPQLSLLSRLNARAYDANGNEICAKEIDPEEAIRNSLSRLSLPVSVPGKPTRPALQVFLDAMADVNRLDASNNGPLAPDDYMNVFKNVHELLTDPKSGLEQLYASVRNATER